MSPEQAKGARHLDARADQYALGVILYECATGTPPFSAEALYTLLQRIVEGRFEPPRARRAELSEAFESVILRAMATQVDARFTSVRALGRALLPFASERARLYHAVRFDRADDARPAPSVAPSAAPIAAPQTTTVSESALELPTPAPVPPARAAARRRPLALLVGLAVLVALSLIAARASTTRVSITPRTAQRPTAPAPPPAPSPAPSPPPAFALPAPQSAPEVRTARLAPARALSPTAATVRVRLRQSATPAPVRPSGPATAPATAPAPPTTDTPRPITTLGGVDVE
jgi:serine/threonine-protein kinase